VDAVLSAQHPGSLAGCGGVAGALAAAHQYALLRRLLTWSLDLPADDVAAVLRSLLSPPAAHAARAAQRDYAAGVAAEAEAAVAAAEAAAGGADAPALLAAAAAAAAASDGFSPAQCCLHPLLAARHDAAALLGALRQLAPPHAVALLRYLARWARNHRRVAGDAAAAAAAALPSPSAVLEWAGLAVDANLSRLMLRPGAAAALRALRQEVAPQLAALRQLSRVRGAVEHIQCGAPLPAPAAGGGARYSLEWLDLKIEA
jgi:hypothetical protein